MEQWIETVIGKMHVNKITQSDLAAALGIRRDYLNKILNGNISPKGAKERILNVLEKMVDERNNRQMV